MSTCPQCNKGKLEEMRDEVGFTYLACTKCNYITFKPKENDTD